MLIKIVQVHASISGHDDDSDYSTMRSPSILTTENKTTYTIVIGRIRN